MSRRSGVHTGLVDHALLPAAPAARCCAVPGRGRPRAQRHTARAARGGARPPESLLPLFQSYRAAPSVAAGPRPSRPPPADRSAPAKNLRLGRAMATDVPPLASAKLKAEPMKAKARKAPGAAGVSDAGARRQWKGITPDKVGAAAADCRLHPCPGGPGRWAGSRVAARAVPWFFRPPCARPNSPSPLPTGRQVADAHQPQRQAHLPR